MKYKLVGLGILFLLCWIGLCPQTGRGAVIWADDFNDGNYDGWTICDNDVLEAEWPGWGFNGSQWSATNYYLQLDPDVRGIITYPNTMAYGTWSFDFKLNETSIAEGATINIISTDHFHTALTVEDWVSERAGIWIDFQPLTANDLELTLFKRYDGSTTTIDDELVPAGGWHHFDVTRTTEGLISVFHNCLLIMEGVDTDIVTSELFAVWCGIEGQMIDNIVVRDDVIIPSCGLPFEIILIGVGVAVVVIVIVLVVILIRRRRS